MSGYQLIHRIRFLNSWPSKITQEFPWNFRESSGILGNPWESLRMKACEWMLMNMIWNERVHGVKGLRVVDASVLPRLTSGTPNSVVAAVAEMAGDLILHHSARWSPSASDPSIRHFLIDNHAAVDEWKPRMILCNNDECNQYKDLLYGCLMDLIQG